MSRHRAPSLLCAAYRRSWLAEWLALGQRGRRFIGWAIGDLERSEAIDRIYGRTDPDLEAALTELREALAK